MRLTGHRAGSCGIVALRVTKLAKFGWYIPNG